jgi:RND superfamily putative drug exporter
VSAVVEAAVRRPRALLGGAGALLVVCVLIAAGAPATLGVGAPEAPGSQSDEAAADLATQLGHEPEPGMLIVTRGRDPVHSGVYQVALDVITSQAKSDPEVAAVRRGGVSEDELTTVLQVYFRDDDAAAQQRAVDRISSDLDPGPLSVQVGGEAATLLDARRALGGQLVGLELLALPLTVLVLTLAVGLRLVVAPLLAAALAVSASIAVLRLAAGPLDLSIAGLLAAAAVGLALALEISLMLVRRHRDELAVQADRDDAVDRAVRVVARPALASSLGGAVAALSLLAIPLSASRSASVGAALAALLAGLASLVVTPAVLTLWGRPAIEGDSEGNGEEAPARGVVPRLTGWIAERRLAALAVAAVSVAALLALAAPVGGTETVALGPTALPADAAARRAEDRLAVELGVKATSRATVAVPSARRDDEDALRKRLKDVDGVATVAPPERGNEFDALAVGLDDRRGSLPARDTVRGIRAAAEPAGGRVAGYDAAALDADDLFDERLPIAAAIAAIALAVLIYAFARRPFLALGLGIASLLPAAAAAGLVELTFGDGRLTGPLDYASQGGPELDAMLAMLAAVVSISAARSAAYPIVLRGERPVAVRRGAPERAARLLLPAAGAATAVTAAAAGVLVGADVLPVKQVGLGIAAGLVLDLVLLRALLIPALGRLLQRARL